MRSKRSLNDGVELVETLEATAKSSGVSSPFQDIHVQLI